MDWQSRGQGFKSPQLHLKGLVEDLYFRLWVSQIWDHVHYLFTIARKTRQPIIVASFSIASRCIPGSTDE